MSDVDGHARRVLAGDAVRVVAWPNDEQIVYVQQRGGIRRVVVIHLDRTGRAAAQASWPAEQVPPDGLDLSPDGKKIVFLKRWGSVADEPWMVRASLNVMPVDGRGRIVEIYRGRAEYGPGFEPRAWWSPDGTRLLVEDAGALFSVESDGEGLRRLSTVAAGVEDSRPVWSPDGTKIAFTSDRGRTGRRRTTDVFVMDADGTHVRRLTVTKPVQPPTGAFGSWGAVWSPDGDGIAFTNNLQAAVVGLNGTGRRAVCTAQPQGEVQFVPVEWRD